MTKKELIKKLKYRKSLHDKCQKNKGERMEYYNHHRSHSEWISEIMADIKKLNEVE